MYIAVHQSSCCDAVIISDNTTNITSAIMKFGLPVTSKILKAKRVNTHVANVTNNGKIAIPIKSLSESNFVMVFSIAKFVKVLP